MSVRKGGQVIAEVADLSSYAKDANVVHKTNVSETIQGTKTFTATTWVNNSGGYYHKATNITSATATPSSTQSAYPVNIYDNSGNNFAQLKVNVNANNEFGLMIKAKDNNWKTGLFCYGTSNGVYTYAPTPSAGDNSTKIATTNFVKNYAMGVPNWAGKIQISNPWTVTKNGYVYCAKDVSGDQYAFLYINDNCVGGASTGHAGTAASGLCAVTTGDVVRCEGRIDHTFMFVPCKNL